MGVKTDPLFDRTTLQPAITDFHNAQSDAERAFHQTRIQHMLEGVVRPIYTATQRGDSDVEPAVLAVRTLPWTSWPRSRKATSSSGSCRPVTRATSRPYRDSAEGRRDEDRRPRARRHQR